MRFHNILGRPKKEKLDHIQTDFVTLASHQLRTPLSGIKWYIEMLLSGRAGKLTEKQAEYLKQIYRSNERAINLVNDLLDVSLIEEGHVHLELRPVKVEQVVEEILDNFSALIKSSKVRVNFHIVGGPLPPAIADAEKLKRVIVNLLSNSVKYTSGGGLIEIKVQPNQHHLIFSIADSGVGIPVADQRSVFQKFYRGQNVARLSPDGTGLGLFIAKSLIGAMGGKIWFESEEGKGTSFYFTLPTK